MDDVPILARHKRDKLSSREDSLEGHLILSRYHSMNHIFDSMLPLMRGYGQGHFGRDAGFWVKLGFEMICDVLALENNLLQHPVG